MNSNTVMKIVAGLALVAGLGAGGASLVAPMGVWLGLWPFGTGFQILGAVNPYTGWIGLGCLITGLILLGLAKKWHTGNGVLLFNLAAGGALAAGIAWYIPTTFQAPAGQSYPPIHDVSTDLENIPQYVAVMPLRADAPNTTVYGGARNMTPERNAQLQQEAFPDLVPQYYDASLDAMFDRALSAVEEMGWELVAAVPAEGRIEATATTFWFRFKDDVVIRLREENGQTRVDARSLSRVGGGDAGTNGKRLRRFFEIL
jgi:uncharacterized protein (DUF1499 family)